MEDKIEDFEFAIDTLDTAITALKKYTEVSKDVTDLELYKSVLESKLDEFKAEQEELEEQEQNEAKNENIERETEYIRSVI